MPGPSTYFDPSRIGELDPGERDLVARRARVLGSAYRLFYREPVQLVRGLGTRVWDAAGTEYLDAYNNVPSVGHSHPRVAEAIAKQAATRVTADRLVGALDVIPQGIVLADAAGQIVFRNRTAASYLTARHGDALVGSLITELIALALGLPGPEGWFKLHHVDPRPLMKSLTLIG